MSNCATKYWGQLDYSPDSVLEFPKGLPGFEQETRFILIEQEQAKPLVFLQSLNTPDLCFVTVHVGTVSPAYKLQITPEDLQTLSLPAGRQPVIGPDVACLAIVHIDERELTANLLAPVIIHIHARRGLQAIMAESGYEIQHKVEPAEAPICS